MLQGRRHEPEGNVEDGAKLFRGGMGWDKAGEHQKGKEQVRTHRPISGDTKGKGAMAVCLEAGQRETMGGIISKSVPEQDNGEQSRLIYYLVCCLIIVLIYILCLYLVPVSVYK